MRAQIGGVDFVIASENGLSDAERELPDVLGDGGSCERNDSSGRRPFRVSMVQSPLGGNLGAMASGEPARITADGDVIRVEHADFQARIDPANRTGRVFRRVPARHPLEISLRVALCSVLPTEGGLPLHAAGVAVGQDGLVFVGASGAGKSTLARNAPYPVFSDELVIVRDTPPRVMASGFWGEHQRDDRPDSGELKAIFALGRGRTTSISGLDPAAAIRRLLSVALVPALPRLWQQVVSQVIRLARAVPVYRLEWNPEASPWEAILEAAGIESAGRQWASEEDQGRGGVEAGRSRSGEPAFGGAR